MKTPTELTAAILEVVGRLPPEERAPAVERLIVERDAEVETEHAKALRRAGCCCGDDLCGEPYTFTPRPTAPCEGEGDCGHAGYRVATVMGKVRACPKCAESCGAVGLSVEWDPVKEPTP